MVCDSGCTAVGLTIVCVWIVASWEPREFLEDHWRNGAISVFQYQETHVENRTYRGSRNTTLTKPSRLVFKATQSLASNHALNHHISMHAFSSLSSLPSIPSIHPHPSSPPKNHNAPSPATRPQRPSSPLIKRPQLLLHLLILGLDDNQRLLDALQAQSIVLDVDGAALVLARAEVLDPFAAVFDFREAERCRRAFQEVSEGAEGFEVASGSRRRRRVRRGVWR